MARNIRFTFGYYRRLVRLLDPHNRQRLQRTIRPANVDSLAVRERPGTGAILVSAHVGDFDLAASWIAEVLGRRPVVPVADLGRPVAQRFYAAARAAGGLTLTSAEATSITELQRHLEAGRLVILTLDRRGGSNVVEIDFLGRPARVPAACFTLAQRTGAPLLSAATWSSEGQRVLSFGAAQTLSDLSGERRTMECLKKELERAIHAAPHQWHVPADPQQLSLSMPQRELPMVYR
ncbi:MAG TPA: lysophospholipid acyltransferase family protein [Solirubrobacterales bacterium]|nr:lysophospholipid acyltransferase family protein [Solirubrobacterales bacterium]